MKFRQLFNSRFSVTWDFKMKKRTVFIVLFIFVVTAYALYSDFNYNTKGILPEEYRKRYRVVLDTTIHLDEIEYFKPEKYFTPRLYNYETEVTKNYLIVEDTYILFNDFFKDEQGKFYFYGNHNIILTVNETEELRWFTLLDTKSDRVRIILVPTYL